MKLYDYAAAPNPRRVRIFLAEKTLKLKPFRLISEILSKNLRLF